MSTAPAATAGARLILVGGGARSGKSSFALRRAKELGERRLFVATAQCYDDEMRARVARHVAERGASFHTEEQPLTPAAALSTPNCDVVVVDCLTLWLSNLLVRGDAPAQIELQVAELLVAIQRATVPVIVVTNEVGLGIVPDNALAREFRDITGRAHQRLAAAADELYLAALGVIVRLKPNPIELVV